MMRRRHFAFSLTVFGSLVACNAISGLNDDYKLADDASVNAQDGAALVDGASVLDGSSAHDGGPITEPDAAAPVDCNAPPGTDHGEVMWCDNFEDATKKWSGNYKTGGLPVVEPNAGRNGTKGLHTKATRSGGTASVSTAFINNFKADVPVGSSLWLSFYFSVNAAAIDYTAIGAIQFSGTEHGIGLYSTAPNCPGGVPCINENDQPAHGHDPKLALKGELGRWYHAEVFISRTASTYASKVVLDGTVINERTKDAMPNGNLNPANSIDLIVGAFYSGAAGSATDVLIDDVVLRQKLN